MTLTKQYNLPITGMTCANCVTTVERNIKKVAGVENVVVNLSSERASIELDSSIVGLDAILARIERAGYGVASGEADLILAGLSDNSDTLRLEKALASIEGVLEAKVNFASEKARVRYIPTLVSQKELRGTIEKLGFEAIELGADAEDIEASVRQAEYLKQKRLMLLGVLFAAPLFFLSMGRDFGLLPSAIAQSGWLDWLFFALATPVQFYVGGSYYVSGYKTIKNN